MTLVTGANQGIGLAVATKLSKEYGHHAIVGSREAAAGAKVASALKAEGYEASSVQLDLNSDASITAVANFIDERFGRLDVLINNAGILLDGKDMIRSTRALFEETMNTNVVGTACLTEAVLPLLHKSAHPRIVFVSSIMGSIGLSTDATKPWYAIDYKAYDASKAAENMLAVNYARILRNVGGLVNVACPGLVKTNLTQYRFGSSTEEGARRIVELATLMDDGPTATFSSTDQPSIPW